MFVYPRSALATRTPKRLGRPRKSVGARTRTAYHEAGHAVLSSAINDTPSHVSIRSNGGTLGRTTQWMSVRPTSLAQVYLAGFAAEHLLTGRRPRQYDLELGMAILALSDAKLAEAFEGYEASDGHGVVEQMLRLGVRGIAEDIRHEADRLYEIARESVSAVWGAVDALAKALLKSEELDRDGIQAVLGEFDLFMKVLVVQRKHGLLLGPPPVAPASA